MTAFLKERRAPEPKNEGLIVSVFKAAAEAVEDRVIVHARLRRQVLWRVLLIPQRDVPGLRHEAVASGLEQASL